MQLEWNEAKRRANLIKHGIDFRDLGPVFDDERRIEVEDGRRDYVEDGRRDYGEVRVVVLGRLHGRLVHVTYTVRQSARRIISARKANPREQRFYERRRASHQGNPGP